MVDVHEVIRMILPACLHSHAIGSHGDDICVALVKKLADSILICAPGLQAHVTKDIEKARSAKKNRWVRMHTERLQTCAVVFANNLRDELEVCLGIELGQRVECVDVLNNNDCIGRACQKAVQEINSERTGNSKSERKKYPFGYLFVARRVA